jgi:hypothetical protein
MKAIARKIHVTRVLGHVEESQNLLETGEMLTLHTTPVVALVQTFEAPVTKPPDHAWTVTKEVTVVIARSKKSSRRSHVNGDMNGKLLDGVIGRHRSTR